MVSPKSRRTDNIDESNNTASLFLGGVRRSWMGPVENRRNSTRDEMPAPGPAPSPGPSQPTQSDSVALLSPVTPGETLQPISRGSAPTAKNPDTPRETALPSPALSANSRPSPVRVYPISSSSRVPSVSTQPPVGNDERVAVQPPNGLVADQSTHSPLAGVQSQTDLPSHPPEYTFSEARPAPQRQNEAPASIPVIPEETWNGWSLQLSSLEEEWNTNGLMQVTTQSGEASVLKARIRLLEQALARKDVFYLVIHQVFCQYSIDTSVLERIRAPVQGMKMLNILLEQNIKMHYSATSRLAHFPYSPQQLFQQPWYKHAMQTVPVFLTRFASEWSKLYYQSNHAPLVSVLSEKFAFSSPILMLVMFVCVCRRLYSEYYIQNLQSLFWKDWESTNRCWASNDPNAAATLHARNQRFMRQYLKYPRKPGLSPQIPFPSDHENRRPVENMSPAQGIRSHSSSSTVNAVPQSTISPHTSSPSGQPLVSNPAPVRYIEPGSGPTPGQPLVSDLSPMRYFEPVSGQPSWHGQYIGGDSQMNVSPGSYYSQMPQGQTPVLDQGQRFNNQIPYQVQSSQRQSPQVQDPQVQNPQAQSPQAQNPPSQTPQPQNPQVQNPQVQNPQIQRQMQYPQTQNQMHMQALRHGQVHPSRAHQAMQMQNSQGQRVTNGSHRVYGPVNSATAANSPTYPLQTVALTSNLPSNVPQSLIPRSTIPTPTSANPPMTQHPNGQVMPQYPHVQHNHQRSPNSRTVSPVHVHRRVYPPQAYQLSHPAQHKQFMSFFAPVGYKAPITMNADPLRLGLHLVNLRDPMKKLVKLGPDGEAIDTELYSYFNVFIVPPTLIDANEPNYIWNFKLAKIDLQRFPRMTKSNDGHLPVWTYQAGCCTIRLRCIRLDHKPDSVEEAEWAISNTYWPSVFYITVNGKELQVRRKVHNGKDLPLDITEHLKAGDNFIRIDLLLGKDECKDSQYYFGVEVMETTTFEDLLRLVKPIPAADARTAIQKRLAPVSEDDDLAVMTDNLTINLVDPFMARIFDVPARSKNCNHAECFDRDTFIRTRKSVSGKAPMVDNWRCPVCKADARPQFLVVDFFLAEIHAELARTNRLSGAQAIQIKADGTWTLRANTDETSPEPQRDSHSNSTHKRKVDGSASSEPAASRPRLEHEDARQSPVSRHHHEIIELD